MKGTNNKKQSSINEENLENTKSMAYNDKDESGHSSEQINSLKRKLIDTTKQYVDSRDRQLVRKRSILDKVFTQELGSGNNTVDSQETSCSNIPQSIGKLPMDAAVTLAGMNHSRASKDNGSQNQNFRP